MRLGPRPTAHASATHRSTESQDRSSFGQQGWNAGPLALSPSCTLVFCSEIIHYTALLCQHSEGSYICGKLGMGKVHPSSSLWIMGIKKGTAASSQAVEHHQSLPAGTPL